MFDFFRKLFDTSGFPPRWYCGSWSAGHGWLHIFSDLGVWSAYLAIPCVLGYFILRKKDVPFRMIFWLFAAFILACGTTHLMEAIIFWWPAYRLAGVIKLATALISWATVLALIPATPRALAMRSPEELEQEISERRRAEAELRGMQAELEEKVLLRTAELGSANARLTEEIQQRNQAEQELREAHEKLEEKVHLRTAELTQANQQLLTEAAERKAAETAQQHSEAMFQVLFEFSPDAILVTNMDGRIQHGNLRSEETFGYSRQELLEQAFENLVTEQFHEILQRVRTEGSVASYRARPRREGFDLVGRRKNGEEFPADILLAAVKTPDGLRLLANIRDASHRKANEAIIKARVKQQAALAEFSQRAFQSTEIIPLLQDASNVVAETLDVEMSHVAELLPNSKAFLLRAGCGWKPGSVGATLFDAGPESIYGCLLKADRPTVFADLRLETRFPPPEFLLGHGAVSGACVLIKGRGGLFGVLGVYARRTRDFTSEDIGFLQLFADMLAAILDRSRAETSVQSSLAEKEVLLKEIHHRVKNNLQIISSLLDLQSHHTQDLLATEMFHECQTRVQSMALVHERLYRSHDLARVDFAGYIESLTDHLFQSYSVDHGKVALTLNVAKEVRLPIDIAIPCGLLINELVSNCLKHAFPGMEHAAIRIDFLLIPEDRLLLTVADNGVGLPEGQDMETAQTFGLQLVSMLVKQLNGRMGISRAGGTSFNMLFPLNRPSSFGETIR